MSEAAAGVRAAVADAEAAVEAWKPKKAADALWNAETRARGDRQAVAELFQASRQLEPRLSGRGARGARRSMQSLTETLQAQLDRLPEVQASSAPLATAPFSVVAPREAGALTIPFWWALASAILMAIGAFGPWVKALSVSVSGTDGSNDGWLVVVAAVVGVLFAYPGTRYRSRTAHIFTLLAGIGGVAVTVYDRHNIRHVASANAFARALVQIGWGLNLALFASISLCLAAIVLVARDSAERPATAAPSPTSTPPQTSTPASSRLVQPELGSRLEKLDELKARGLVTDAEYAERRAAILADL